MRMSICQIDLNNFAILSPSTSARTGTAALTFKEVTDILKNIGCKYAYGLDSGGSTSFFFKGSNSALFGPGNLYDGRIITDILYFVEQ